MDCTSMWPIAVGIPVVALPSITWARRENSASGRRVPGKRCSVTNCVNRTGSEDD